MKKFRLLIFSALFIFVLSACGSNSADETGDKQANSGQVETETTNPDQAEADKNTSTSPIEATKEHVCAFCDMEVYTKDEDMGVFTAQAINSEGNNLFFDDSGCLLNFERKTGEALKEMWVRDYITHEWVSAKETFPVHADMKTPMKYGYSFFETEEEADKFVSENADINAAISSWDEIDKISHERYLKKMQMKKEGTENNDHMGENDHGDDHGEGSEGSH